MLVISGGVLLLVGDAGVDVGVDVGGVDVCEVLAERPVKEGECIYGCCVRPENRSTSYRAHDHRVRRYLNSLDIRDCHNELRLCSPTYRS